MTTNSPFNAPRAPMADPCAGKPNAPPQAIDNPCAYIPQLRAALYALLAGAQAQEVRFGDQLVRYHNGNIPHLRAELRRLEIQCNNAGPRAVRAGPYVPTSAPRYPFMGRGPFAFW